MKQLVRYFEVVAELHKMGYEQIRLSEYVAPNGCAMRCWITVKSCCWVKLGALVCEGANTDLAVFTHNGEFLWNTEGMSAAEIAAEFVRRYPRIAQEGKGKDPKYVKWFKIALDEARQGFFFSAIDEWRNPIEDGYLDLGQGHKLPLPPAGGCTRERR